MSALHNDTTGRLNYAEFSVRSAEKAEPLYQEAVSWAAVDFEPAYAANVSGDADIGLQAGNPNGTKPSLPFIQVGELEASLERTLEAGAVLVTPIFPGGRRFHG